MRASLAALMLLAATLASGQTVVDDHVAVEAAQVPEANAAVAALRRTAAAGNTALLARQLAGFDQGLAAGDIARERVVSEGLLLLLGLPPDDSVDAILARWAEREARVFVWLREGGHRTPVPLYDVGAAARAVAHRWEILRARDRTLTQLRAGVPIDALTSPVKRADPETGTEGAVLAVRMAPADTLPPIEAPLIAGLAAGRPLTALAFALYERQPSPALAAALADHGDPAALTHRLDTLLEHSDAPAVLLERLTTRTPLASAALIAAAPLAARDTAIRAMLLRRLSDRATGASAALALARSARIDDSIRATLITMASAKSGDALSASRARLALTLYDEALLPDTSQ